MTLNYLINITSAKKNLKQGNRAVVFGAMVRQNL